MTVDNRTALIDRGHSVYIPLGSRHRLENPGSSPIFIIEVQIGEYLGEDDIERYDDVYSRD